MKKNEDLKKAVYQRVLGYVEDPKNIGILLAKRFANAIKEIYFYSSDFSGNGKDLFQMEYNMEYDNGDIQEGNCSIDTEDVLSAFGFKDYEELKSYLVNKYNEDNNAWRKIVDEMREKGLSPMVDEDEGGYNYMMNL